MPFHYSSCFQIDIRASSPHSSNVNSQDRSFKVNSIWERTYFTTRIWSERRAVEKLALRPEHPMYSTATYLLSFHCALGNLRTGYAFGSTFSTMIVFSSPINVATSFGSSTHKPWMQPYLALSSEEFSVFINFLFSRLIFPVVVAALYCSFALASVMNDRAKILAILSAFCSNCRLWSQSAKHVFSCPQILFCIPVRMYSNPAGWSIYIAATVPRCTIATIKHHYAERYSMCGVLVILVLVS